MFEVQSLEQVHQEVEDVDEQLRLALPKNLIAHQSMQMSQRVMVSEACSRKLCARRCVRWECGVATVAEGEELFFHIKDRRRCLSYRVSGRKERINLDIITQVNER
uniref:Uncharacterized protein n=1 Tax=Arundo donax TaxID=35708 RepID=A0A0A8YPT3_ARUDO